jgi:hypothetical protein
MALFVIQNQQLHAVSPDTGAAAVRGGAAWHSFPILMTSIADGLYAIESARLHYVNPKTGDFQAIGNHRWRCPQAITHLGGFLYIIDAPFLYRVNPTTGEATAISGEDWKRPPIQMAALDGGLYLIENARLHHVDPGNGAWEIRGDGSWVTGLEAMTSHAGFLYVIENSRLHRVNSGGGYDVIGPAQWTSSPVRLTTLGDWLYAFTDRRLYRVSPRDGHREPVGSDNWETDSLAVMGCVCGTSVQYELEIKKDGTPATTPSGQWGAKNIPIENTSGCDAAIQAGTLAIDFDNQSLKYVAATSQKVPMEVWKTSPVGAGRIMVDFAELQSIQGEGNAGPRYSLRADGSVKLT